MSESRIWSLAPLPAGLAVGHLLSSAALDGLGLRSGGGLGHGVLQGLGCLAVPLLLVALARSVLGGTRSELPPVSLSSLAVAQVGLFLLIELIEHAAAGIAPEAALREPSLALGLLAQLVVAWALWAALRVAARAASRWVERKQNPRRAQAPVPAVRRAHRPAGLSVAVSSLSRRGPPFSLVS